MNPSVDRSSPSTSNSGNHGPESPRPSTQPEAKTSQQVATESVSSPQVTPVSPVRQQPISPPSHPRQYRAIGLIQGQYLPSQEQLTRGALLTSEGTAIDTVLLGRMISLVKNHLDLAQPHLWVVYPRTRQEEDQLHIQVVGIWEPETLSQESAKEEEEKVTTPESIQSGYFSVRGEVVYASTEKELVIVKIRQSPKKAEEKPKHFKLKLQGTLPDKPVGNFWDLEVQLEGNSLKIQQGTNLGPSSRKKKGNFKKTGKKPYRKENRRSSSSDSRPVIKGKKGEDLKSTPKKSSLSKPIKRPQKSE